MTPVRRRHLTNPQLLVLLVTSTLLISGLGAAVDPQARLTSLLIFLPAIVAGIGKLGQTVFAAVWAFVTVFASVSIHPEPTIGDTAVLLALTAVFGAGAVYACRVRLDREAEIARLRFTATALQRQVLRPLPQVAEPVQVDGVYEPVTEDRLVGGDIYDVAETDFGTRVLIGDVQGKGLAALGTGLAVIGAFREAAQRELTLTGLVDAIEAATNRFNDDAVHGGEPERFVTALVLGFQSEAGSGEAGSGDVEVTVIDCGHLPAYALDGSGPRRLDFGESGVPLGLADLVAEPRRERRFPLPKGTTLVLYTDGLTEARNGDGVFYPLEDRLALFGGLTPRGLAQALHEDVREFAPRQQDDLAILVVRPVW
ncbi:serine/threonine-protein phosphatase [Actinospica durhamensis]|uniref:Serine/threonine-protein phosphatase n=1 Tax=Actinospica durhamensis TaxID=1508375 RepID=A0A941EU10_9ACTN|nr:PP2C family protein-serine/threonine phosphatase [Actinospica durhamensis]MBR7838082.1 serine/threonine-protein phosphatase [Actinospica durhamensis]